MIVDLYGIHQILVILQLLLYHTITSGYQISHYMTS